MHKVDPKQSLPKMEEEVLKYWKENNIFEQSVAKDAPMGEYTFYDGPPFATGTPHYGHIVGSVLKDVVPRYWTMRGFRVERRWGWDCHGLPIENIAEKELGIKRKKDIETLGVEKFNEFCRSKVLGYTEEWKRVITRLGRWADMENPYSTMDTSYMESVWWVFKQLWDKGLIYESYRIMHVCTRCETTLSQQEVSEGYMDVKDLSATVKFKLEPGQKISDFETDDNTYILAWTTTPWTLPGNVALAVGKDIEYARVKIGNEYFICAKSLVDRVFVGKEHSIDAVFLGDEFIGRKYHPPFDAYSQDENLKNRENGWKIYAGDFVNTEDGTGVVHIAPAFGEDDWNLAQRENLPFVQHVNLDGTIKPEVRELSGLSVKPKENPQATDIEVIKYLAGKGLLFAKEKYEHSYPHCWRCDTPLINYATSSWFVKVTDVKERALENAQHIEWSPEHIKAGRFGKWLEGARDWAISRQRFWASVMPVWKCEKCSKFRVFGSVHELEEASGQAITDLHKHVVDKVVVSCECGTLMHRIPDVLDTWFDSGSMPYAQQHYPFENRDRFERNFPAEFIAEGVDQTRSWFYYLHVLGTALFDRPAYRNVVVNGTVQAEDGKKMSKKLKNYPDPSLLFDTHGADAMRLYLLSSPVVMAENVNFSEKEMGELSRNVFRMLWNSYSFFTMYAEIDKWKPSEHGSKSANILDRWILSELQTLIGDVNAAMERYDIARAARLFAPFIDHLSNWYIRRSRKRFWKNENDTDKNEAYQTLYDVLVTLAKLMAPFTPFVAEEIYRNLTGEESVHLTEYPKATKGLVDSQLNESMQAVREIITIGLQKRAEAKIKVRQPLREVRLKSEKYRELFEVVFGAQDRVFLEQIIFEELNVKGLAFSDALDADVTIDTTITPELKLEGEAREVIRFIQELRKEAGYDVDNRIEFWYKGSKEIFETFGEMIAHEVLATRYASVSSEPQVFDISKSLNLNSEESLTVWLRKV